METKTFDVPTLASIVTGVLLADSFSKVHEAAEWILGHQVWTHEFASKATFERMRGKVLEQHPDLDIDATDVDRENVREYVSELVARLGESREIQRGTDQRTKNPVETLTDALDTAG